jgi:predicted DNA-binding transcriptional regulator YafY
MASLPVSMRAQANAIRQRLHIDTTGWRGLTEMVDALPVVQEAVARDRRLSFRYRKPDGQESERAVDPLGLVAKGSAWYLVANTSEGFRSFRVSRIEAPVLLPTPCERPRGFDLAAHWKASTEQLREGRPKYAATFRVDPRASERLEMWRPRPIMDPAGPASDRGWVTREVQFDDEEQACFVALGFGPRAEVLAPRGLRERVRREIEAAFLSTSERARGRPNAQGAGGTESGRHQAKVSHSMRSSPPARPSTTRMVKFSRGGSTDLASSGRRRRS